MKIAQVCDYVAPARDTMGAERIVERVTKGLVAAGHDVTMVLKEGSTCPVPGAHLAHDVIGRYDVLHFHGWEPLRYSQYKMPWLATVHGYQLHQNHELAMTSPIVAVSAFAQEALKARYHVWNCADEDEFTLQEQKEPYFLWMAGTDWGENKGLFTTIAIAKRLRCKLKIAGTGRIQPIIEAIIDQCDDNIEYLGAVNGDAKVKLLQNARALVLLTLLPDACPVTVSEALMCGTPVIGSNCGSMPEIVKHGVTGFICATPGEAMRAMAAVNRIEPRKCREYALEHFSTSTCANKYAKLYSKIIESHHAQFQRAHPAEA